MTMTNETILDPSLYEFGIFRGLDIYENIPSTNPIIEGILNEHDHLVISSRAGSGKSILALQMICSLTTGRDFLDTFQVPKPVTVLYVQTEGNRSETIHRLKHMKKGLNIDDERWAHYNAIGIPLNTEGGLRHFSQQVLATKMLFDVIIIDPLYPTIKGSLNQDDVATDWQRGVRELKKHFPRVAYVVFHHEPSKDAYDNRGNKVQKPSDDLFGSSLWGAWMTGNYKMLPVSGDEHKRILQGGKGDGGGRAGQGSSEIRLRLIEPSPLFFVIDDDSLNEIEGAIYKIISSADKKFRRIELEGLIEVKAYGMSGISYITEEWEDC